MRSRVVGVFACLTWVAAGTAHAQVQVFQQQDEFRGPFQTAVVGSSLVQQNGVILPQASATLNLGANRDVVLHAARLYWFGSNIVIDDDAVFQIGNATPIPIAAFRGVPEDPNTDDCVILNSTFRPGADYFACHADVTADIGTQNLNARYTVGDVSVITLERPDLYCEPNIATCAYEDGDPLADDRNGFINPFVDDVFAGGWALLLVYRDTEDNAPRIIQLGRGLATQGQGSRLDNVLSFRNLELSNVGGRLTHVAMGGDRFIFTSPVNDGEHIFLTLANGDVIPPQGGRRAVIDNVAASPDGNLYNESISSEFANELVDVTEQSGIDIDVYDISSAFDPNTAANNRFIDDDTLNLRLETGVDVVGHVLVVVEVADLDSDGDGLSNLEETCAGKVVGVDCVATNPNNPDSDGDGLCDGAVDVREPDGTIICFGGEDRNRDRNPADIDPANRVETDPNNPDTDGDGLCDGFRTVPGVCVGGENLNGGGLNTGETDPLNVDTDGDGLCDGDGRPLSTPAYGECRGPENANGGGIDAGETDPAEADTDGDGLCDGDRAVVGVCERGEDLNRNGVRDVTETDPRDPDTDGDGINDGREVLGGDYGGPVDANPNVNGFQTDPLNVDTDGDGRCDGTGTSRAGFGGPCTGGEDVNVNGTVDTGETDPTNANDGNGNEGEGEGEGEGEEPPPDRDNDGLPDAVDPFPDDPDGDNDGILDGDEDRNANGVVDPGETDPRNANTDGDGLCDGSRRVIGVCIGGEDRDGDGQRGANETDPTNPDTDGDGLCDGPGTVVGVCVGGEDLDGDGYEVGVETDPLNPDTDGDGLLDGTEVLVGAYDGDAVGDAVDNDPDRPGRQTDPLNPDSDGDGRCDGSKSVVGVCEAGEDVDNDGSLGDGETDPTDPGSLAAANCAPTDENFPTCVGLLPPPPPDEDLLIKGSALFACGAAQTPASWLPLAMLAAFIRRRRAS